MDQSIKINLSKSTSALVKSTYKDTESVD